MPTYISLLNFTDKGAQQIKDTCKRESAFASVAQKLGVTVQHAYWTMGPYDGVVVFEAPDEESATAALLSLAASGNVRTQTCRAFTAKEMEKVVAKAP